MFKTLSTIGAMVFFAIGFLVFELSFVEMFFLILMFLFYFCSGYYYGLTEKRKSSGYLSEKDVNNLFRGSDKK